MLLLRWPVGFLNKIYPDKLKPKKFHGTTPLGKNRKTTLGLGAGGLQRAQLNSSPGHGDRLLRDFTS